MATEPSRRRRRTTPLRPSGNEQNDTLRRLEDSLSNVVDGFATQRDNVSSLKVHLEHLERQQTNMSAEWKSDIESITTGFRNDMSRFNVALENFSVKLEAKKFPSSIIVGLASAGLLALGMITGLAVFFVNAEIGNAIAPLTNAQSAMVAQLANIAPRLQNIEIASSNSTAADQRSNTDRIDLNRRISIEEDRNSKIEAEIARIASGNVEIETQFTTVKQQIYYIWEKVFGSSLPIVPRDTPASMGGVVIGPKN
jgi:predicted  nucleic acid-binding Zn-ribbon protein